LRLDSSIEGYAKHSKQSLRHSFGVENTLSTKVLASSEFY